MNQNEHHHFRKVNYQVKDVKFEIGKNGRLRSFSSSYRNAHFFFMRKY